eukprot:TRINITY_DN2791_c0_g1_i2.p1 TRINITY_DN2791_c0_g1~~TRINITY_DN2791_c0_g1_i2.p1  ORF type:complete len:170 (+),score=63.54 TRINITY_DN2791_c0_g1_i2:78-587(+)
MSDAKDLVLEVVEGDLVKIILNRSNRGNSINGEMMNQLISLIDKYENDEKIRIILLTGNGKFFCTGMDLSNASQSQIKGKSGGGDSLLMFERIRSCKKPTIAVVNGPAIGGGVGLFFCCDFRIVVRDSWFQMPEVMRGIVPALISAVITPSLGHFATKQFMLTGKPFPV